MTTNWWCSYAHAFLRGGASLALRPVCPGRIGAMGVLPSRGLFSGSSGVSSIGACVWPRLFLRSVRVCGRGSSCGPFVCVCVRACVRACVCVSRVCVRSLWLKIARQRHPLDRSSLRRARPSVPQGHPRVLCFMAREWSTSLEVRVLPELPAEGSLFTGCGQADAAG